MPHRRKRPRRALPGNAASGRLEPRVGRSMVGDRHHGRCDQRYLLGLPPKRAPCRASRGCPRRSGPRACSARYADRASHYWNTPEAGGNGQGHPDPGRPRPARTPAYSPEARGRCTLQKRLKRLAGDMAGANRFLKEVFLTPARDPGRGPGHRVPFTGALNDTASTRNALSQTTTRCATSAWHFRSPHRRHYVKARVRAMPMGDV